MLTQYSWWRLWYLGILGGRRRTWKVAWKVDSVCAHTRLLVQRWWMPLSIECTDKEHHTCTFISGRTEVNEHARKYKKVNQKPSCKPVPVNKWSNEPDCEAPQNNCPQILTACVMLWWSCRDNTTFSRTMFNQRWQPRSIVLSWFNKHRCKGALIESCWNPHSNTLQLKSS